VRLYAGRRLSKVALRAAYLKRLPTDILSREFKTPYVAVTATMVRRNRRYLTDLLGPESMLASLSVTSHAAIADALNAERDNRDRSELLMRMAAVELWLRKLAAHPVPQRLTTAATLIETCDAE